MKNSLRKKKCVKNENSTCAILKSLTSRQLAVEANFHIVQSLSKISQFKKHHFMTRRTFFLKISLNHHICQAFHKICKIAQILKYLKNIRYIRNFHSETKLKQSKVQYFREMFDSKTISNNILIN